MKTTSIFQHQRKVSLRMRCLSLKGGKPIRGPVLRVVLISSPNIDNIWIEVSIMSGERLLEAREEGRRRNEWVYKEDTGVKRIPFEMGCYLTAVSIMPIYTALTSWTNQGAFV